MLESRRRWCKGPNWRGHVTGYLRALTVEARSRPFATVCLDRRPDESFGDESHRGLDTRVGQAVDRVESCLAELPREERSSCWCRHVAGDGCRSPWDQHLLQLEGRRALTELPELLVLLLGDRESLVVHGRLHFLDARQCIGHDIVSASDVAEVCRKLAHVV
jgi:hypothetical protein